MRENRKSPSLEEIPATGVGTLVPFLRVPQADRTVIALCSAPFEEFLKRNGVEGEHRHRVLEGGGYRGIGVQLSSGRHAVLVKYDERPSFEISLDIWRGLHVFRADFYEVYKLLDAPASTIQFCDGPVLWR